MGKQHSAAPGDLLAHAQRLLSRGDAKSALKQARVLYRTQASADHRQFLERTYVARVEQLHRTRQIPEAQAVLAQLLQLPPTLPEVRDQLPKLKALVGMPGADAAAALSGDPDLLTKLADDAVLDERCTPPEALKDQVSRVRNAFLAVERGDDASAANLLKEIPRSSPLGEWKLLVRGLSAFYQADQERAWENWRRLDPNRPPHLIGKTLMAAAGELPKAESDPRVATGLRRLEAGLPKAPALGVLKRIASAWARGKWTEFAAGLNQLRARFAESHSAEIETIVDLAWKRAAREGNRRLLKQLVSTGCASALDPHWNRAWAVLEENAEYRDIGTADKCWTAYANDVLQLTQFSEEERSLASGLVCAHQATLFLEYARECQQDAFFFDPRDEEDRKEAEWARKQAVRLLKESIRRSPSLVTAYQALAALHEQSERPDEAAATFRDLLRPEPHDYTAHTWLAHYHLGRDEPEQAEPHVTAAIRLKPRDPASETLRWNLQVTSIRCLALKRRFAEAREAWERACQVKGSRVEPYTLETLRAGIEFRAKDREAAERFLNAALARVEQPTAVWLQMSGTAARFKLPRELKKEFDARYSEGIQQRPDSATLGRIARFLHGYKVSQTNYTGRATHERLFLNSLQRGADKVRWAAEDLRDVCRFLEEFSNQWALWNRLVNVGLKQSPYDPFFNFWTARSEFERGPFACDIEKAAAHVRRALKSAEAGRSPEERELAEQARQMSSLIEDAQERMRPLFRSSGSEDEEPFGDEDEPEEDRRRQFDFGFGSDDSPGRRSPIKPPNPELEGLSPETILEMMEEVAGKMGIDLNQVLPDMEDAEADRGGERSRRRKR